MLLGQIYAGAATSFPVVFTCGSANHATQSARSVLCGAIMIDRLAQSGRLPTFFIPHGGGPCFFIDWPGEMAGSWDTLAGFLRGLRSTIGMRPKAIVVISAHWEVSQLTLTDRADSAPLLYDYSGFPPHTYALQYPAPGSPAVAQRMRDLLQTAGIRSRSNVERGFDHGVFIPFMLVEPEAAIPIVQLSLVAGLDPSLHVAIGNALAPLRDEGVLIVGSGMSYHNMQGFSRHDAPNGAAFDTWLSQTVEADPQERTQRLVRWREAPEARLAHPREEHLLPLMVAAGAGGVDSGKRIFNDRIIGATISAYRFG